MSENTPALEPEVQAGTDLPEESFQDFKAGKDSEPVADPAPEVPPAPTAPVTPPAVEPPKRPWHEQNQIPPERLQIRLEKTQQELEALRRQIAPPAPPAPEQAPQKPRQEDFIKDGQFDSAAYLDAFGAFTRAEALRDFRAEQVRNTEQAAAMTAEQEARTVVQSFDQRVQEYASQDPDIAAGVAHFRQNYGNSTPEIVARELLHADPRIMYTIACSEDLTAQVVRGDIARTLKVIGILEDRIAAHDKAESAKPAAPAPQVGAYIPGSVPGKPPVPPAAPQASRNDAGQFSKPPVPSEYGAASGGGANPILSDDYGTFKKARRTLE